MRSRRAIPEAPVANAAGVDCDALTAALIAAVRPRWRPVSETPEPKRISGSRYVRGLQQAMRPILKRLSVVEMATLYPHLVAIFNSSKFEDTVEDDAVFWGNCLIEDMIATHPARSLADAKARLQFLLDLDAPDRHDLLPAVEHALKHDLGRAWPATNA